MGRKRVLRSMASITCGVWEHSQGPGEEEAADSRGSRDPENSLGGGPTAEVRELCDLQEAEVSLRTAQGSVSAGIRGREEAGGTRLTP